MNIFPVRDPDAHDREVEQLRESYAKFLCSPTEKCDPVGVPFIEYRRNGEARTIGQYNQLEALSNLPDDQCKELNAHLAKARATGDYASYGFAVAGMVVGYWAEEARRLAEKEYPY